MSIARVHTVQRARQRYETMSAVADKTHPLPLHECDKCGTTIEVGQSYRWWVLGFRSRHKLIRCMSASCTPRQSELESSKLSSLYAAQEDALDMIDGCDDVGDVESAVSSVGEAAQELADEYREAAQDANGNVFNTLADERADELESIASELDEWGASTSEPESCDEHDELSDDCDECQQALDAYLDELRAEARDAIDSAVTL